MGVEIKLENVHYRYPGQDREALQGVTVTFKPGRITGVMGPNAAGKTTLLKMAAALLKPVKGRVKIMGVDPWRDGSVVHVRRRVVYVHEKPPMLRGTVLDNITLPLRLRGMPKKEAVRLAVETARSLGIDNILKERAKALSTGQRHLVAIARALVLMPEALLLDEPLANVDHIRRPIIIKTVKELVRNGVTIAIASHDTLTLTQLASHAIYLEEGRIIMEGSVEDIARGLTLQEGLPDH
ncbi:MAG: ABC transporter ATP-binding protein [Desulfurococcales archaeon]|nr:ABC transporter ATP-binding protein [Desulfurococcales archaeon]